VPILVACECGNTFQARDEAAGGRAVCPACGREQPVPRPAYVTGDELGGIPTFEPQTSGKALASLILGFTALFPCSVFTGIPAIVLGALGLSDIDSSKGQLKGRKIAMSGIVLGALSCALVPVLLVVGVLAGLMLPAVQSAREAARRAQCSNNFKRVGLAMHNFQSAEGHFPPAAITDKQGKPLLSWRVAILPFLEEQELYRQFHLNEPWDSPHNSALLSKMPHVYACPSVAASSNNASLTTYQVLVGPGAAFDDQGGATVADIADGLGSTLFVVEAKNAVPWTKPEDLPYDPKGALPRWGSNHAPAGFNVLFGDGAVKYLTSRTAERTLRALITRNGHEMINTVEY
jgi:hypothetical protein